MECVWVCVNLSVYSTIYTVVYFIFVVLVSLVGAPCSQVAIL